MRDRALLVLAAVDAGAFAQDRLLPEDPPFVRELVLGVLRRRLTLDAILEAFGKRPLASLDADLRAALRAGLYQLFFMDGVPPHAAVAETVGALRLHSRRAYCNAVLRAVLRESRRVPVEADRGGCHPSKRLFRAGRSVTFFSRAVFPDPARDRIAWLSVLHSHPAFLVQRWVDAVGEEEALRRMEAGNATPPLVLRPRRGRADARSLAEKLAGEGLAVRLLPRAGGDAVEAPSNARRLFSSRAFREGLFSVQDLDQMDAAEILVEALDAVEGASVWDACAAPGGKAAQLAELLAERGGRVLATDADAARLSRVSESAQRLGLTHLEVAEHDVLAAEPPPGKPARGFDAILLDAPCSNTAVLGRRPEARWRLRAETFAELAEVQARLLEAVQRHLAPGGRLIYSVCSFEPEEGAGHGLIPTRSPFAWLAP